jgi:hypothetical protein
MTTLVTRQQRTWNQSGGDLLVYFTAVGDYQWGFTHDDSVLSTKKLIGIDQVNASVPATGTAGVAIPATIQASNFSSPAAYLAPDPMAMAINAVGPESGWTWLGYVINNSTAGAFSIALNAGSAGSLGQAEVYVDGALSGTITIPNTGANTTSQLSAAVVTPTLSVGTHGLLIKARAGSFGFDSIVIAAATTTPPAIPVATNVWGVHAGNGWVALQFTASTGGQFWDIYRGTSAGNETLLTTIPYSVADGTGFYTDTHSPERDHAVLQSEGA